MTDMYCPSCHRPLVALTAQGLSHFTLRMCAHCDLHAWTVDGNSSSIDHVVRVLRDEERHLDAA